MNLSTTSKLPNQSSRIYCVVKMELVNNNNLFPLHEQESTVHRLQYWPV